MRTHVAEWPHGDLGELVRALCGVRVVEKDGFHCWDDGDRRFWGRPLDEVDCRRCLRVMKGNTRPLT